MVRIFATDRKIRAKSVEMAFGLVGRAREVSTVLHIRLIDSDIVDRQPLAPATSASASSEQFPVIGDS